MIKLSKRLETIAEQIPAGSRMADIGSDHALLPAFLLEKGRIEFAVAGEVNPGPYEAARRQVAALAERERGRIAVRLGDGLTVVEPGEVDTVAIAGMGGNLIVQILTEGEQKLAGVRTLVLQPNVGEPAVRRWLLERGWALAAERIVEEDGKIYEILTADRRPDAERVNEALYDTLHLEGGVRLDREMQLLMGPHLLREGAPELIGKWRRELDKMELMLSQLARSELSSSRAKERDVRAEMSRIKEVIACLPTDRR